MRTGVCHKGSFIFRSLTRDWLDAGISQDPIIDVELQRPGTPGTVLFKLGDRNTCVRENPGKIPEPPVSRGKMVQPPSFKTNFSPVLWNLPPLHPLTVTPLNYTSATVLPNLTFPFFKGEILSIKMYVNPILDSQLQNTNKTHHLSLILRFHATNNLPISSPPQPSPKENPACILISRFLPQSSSCSLMARALTRRVPGNQVSPHQPDPWRVLLCPPRRYSWLRHHSFSGSLLSPNAAIPLSLCLGPCSPHSINSKMPQPLLPSVCCCCC